MSCKKLVLILDNIDDEERIDYISFLSAFGMNIRNPRQLFEHLRSGEFTEVP